MTEVSEDKKKEIRQRLYDIVKDFSNENKLLRPYFEKLDSATKPRKLGRTEIKQSSDGEEYFGGIVDYAKQPLKNKLDNVLSDCIIFLKCTDCLNGSTLELGEGIKNYLRYNYFSIADKFHDENYSYEKSALIHRYSLSQEGFMKQFESYVERKEELTSQIKQAGLFEKKRLRVEIKKIDKDISNLKNMVDLALEKFESGIKQQDNDRS